MRSFGVLVFALAVATGFAAPAGNGTENKVEELIDAYLTYSQAAAVKNNQISLRNVDNLPIVSIIPPVGILLSADNRTMTGLANNTVSNLKVVNNTASYTMTFPDIRMQSDYKVGGLYYGRPIKGQGKASLDIALTVDVSVTVSNRQIRWPLTNSSYLQLDQLTERITLQSLSSNFTGLAVAGLSPAEVKQQLDAQMTTVWSVNLPIWSELQSGALKSQINLALVGSSIDDAINWLKKNTANSTEYVSMVPLL